MNELENTRMAEMSCRNCQLSSWARRMTKTSVKNIQIIVTNLLFLSRSTQEKNCRIYTLAPSILSDEILRPKHSYKL